MIVVDTSVWIDVINEVETPAAALCIQLLEDGAPVALTDVIFTEVLQGFRTEREANAVEHHLRNFPSSDWRPWTTSLLPLVSTDTRAVRGSLSARRWTV